MTATVSILASLHAAWGALSPHIKAKGAALDDWVCFPHEQTCEKKEGGGVLIPCSFLRLIIHSTASSCYRCSALHPCSSHLRLTLKKLMVICPKDKKTLKSFPHSNKLKGLGPTHPPPFCFFRMLLHNSHAETLKMDRGKDNQRGSVITGTTYRVTKWGKCCTAFQHARPFFLIETVSENEETFVYFEKKIDKTLPGMTGCFNGLEVNMGSSFFQKHSFGKVLDRRLRWRASPSYRCALPHVFTSLSCSAYPPHPNNS